MGVFNNKVEIEELKKRLTDVEIAIAGGIGASADLKLVDSVDGKNVDTISLKKKLTGRYLAVFTQLKTSKDLTVPTISFDGDYIKDINHAYHGSNSEIYTDAILFTANDKDVNMELVGNTTQYTESMILLFEVSDKVLDIDITAARSSNDNTSVTYYNAAEGDYLHIGLSFDALQTRNSGLAVGVTAEDMTVFNIKSGRILGTGYVNNVNMQEYINKSNYDYFAVKTNASGSGYGNGLIIIELIKELEE